MKIILAPDKFKGSLTGIEFCNIIEPILSSNLNAEVIKLPLADGGDGTIEVINYYLDGKTIQAKVNNPIFESVLASYLYSENSKVAFIEMAEASGMKLLDSKHQNCMYTSTYGTGELILDAIDKGAEYIILGLGGSATNDCGIGMATALGYRFLDEENKEVKPIGSQLISINSIDNTLVDKRLKSINFQIACDVTNPLYGEEGAAYIYAKQKGANDSEIEYLDNGLQNISKVLDHHFNIVTQKIKGAGAAGGMGAGCVTFLNAELSPGIELIKEMAQFDSKIKGADWIITGEGQFDDQTLSGKALSGVINSAKNDGINVAAFCGNIDLERDQINQMGITYYAAIMDKAKNFEDAILNTKLYLKEITEVFTQKISL
ncbi:glycerate kinase [Winogradskyella sp. PG-2]|uniref:glycerate kinase n=1 Tax=Winogradskyella sp. PG-2 TaxID=754409 RepID=UPI0004587E17|nr:glycerate kinase [Winogradskyella sp. PG-2]BAO75888.1 glycerate kinase [Winogradskyella sp. PG-2]